jgi:hypothetical protein
MQNGSDMSFSQPPPISMLFLREDFFCKKIICLLAATFYKIRFNSNPSAHQFREKIWVNVSLFVPLPFLCNRRAVPPAKRSFWLCITQWLPAQKTLGVQK